MNGYLFVHFKGTESTPDEEQIYFALSRDALTWQNVNGGKPIMKSELGEKGLRDPHILRAENGKFYMIATDLSIYSRRGMKDMWTDCQTRGSRQIAVWESDDLVNWSEQRMVTVAAEDAGCAWAPESIYDHERGEYMVFWASKTAEDGFKKQRIWRAYTKDFINFSKPEKYIDREYSVIDTSIIYESGVYYRFTKDEDAKTVFLECCESLNGEFKRQDNFTLKNDYGYEGPTICKFNDESGWCLLMDNFATHEGYKPFITQSIAEAQFRPLPGFDTPDIFRHGTIVPITEKEYQAIAEKYGI